MNPLAPSQSTIESLRKLVRDVSVVQARQYFGDEGVNLDDRELELKPGQVVARHMSMVLITSNDLRIVFKVHFNTEAIRASRRQVGRPWDPNDHAAVIDFMKELTNQMGGRLCRVLGTHHLTVGMSVPLCTRGTQEIHAEYDNKIGPITRISDLWRLQGPFRHLFCSCFIELPHSLDLSDIRIEDEEAEEGELDFL